MNSGKKNITDYTSNDVVIIDNYDSFTYNLVHIVEKITQVKPIVFKNDEFDLASINNYRKIILSPGPGIPKEAGLLLPLIKQYAFTKSILGVCLGHQAIAEAFGGSLQNLSTVYHGVASSIYLTQVSGERDTLFDSLPDQFEVGRYHSWVADSMNFPDCLIITAKDIEGNIMAFKHKTLDIRGVQFHPESILTPLGETILRNWLNTLEN